MSYPTRAEGSVSMDMQENQTKHIQELLVKQIYSFNFPFEDGKIFFLIIDLFLHWKIIYLLLL